VSPILLLLPLAALAIRALVRLGRQTEGTGRGQWRVTATLLAAVLIGGGVIALARGGFVLGPVLIAVGLYLTVQSRDRPAGPREPGMSAEEARAVLGVSAEADAAAIQAAWRRLMARAHPDQGGTEGLAARLNAARDRLLRK